MLAVTLGATTGVHAQTYAWNVTTDGDWSDSSNWNPDTGIPNGVGHVATLRDGFTAEYDSNTVNLDQSITLGTLSFSTNYSYSNWILSRPGASADFITLDNGASAAEITTGQGGSGDYHSIEVPLLVESSELNWSGRRTEILGDITAATGNDLTFNVYVDGGNGGLVLAGNNNFNNGIINLTRDNNQSLTLASANAAGGSSTTINVNDAGLAMDLSGGSLNFGNDLNFTGTSSITATNAGTTNTGTFTNVALAEDADVTLSRTSGNSRHGILVVGNNGTMTLGDNSVFRLRWPGGNSSNNTVARLVIADGSLLQGTGFFDAFGSGAGSTGTYVDVQAGGTLRAGTDAETGILSFGGVRDAETLAGFVTLREDSILSFRLNGTIAGTDYDQIFVGGTVTTDAGEVTGELTDEGALLDLDVGYGYSPTDLVFLMRTIVSVDGLGGYMDGQLIDLYSGEDLWGTATISYYGDFMANTATGGTDMVLYNFSAIPEPATAGALLGLLSLVAVGLRRRREV